MTALTAFFEKKENGSGFSDGQMNAVNAASAFFSKNGKITALTAFLKKRKMGRVSLMVR